MFVPRTVRRLVLFSLELLRIRCAVDTFSELNSEQDGDAREKLIDQAFDHKQNAIAGLNKLWLNGDIGTALVSTGVIEGPANAWFLSLMADIDRLDTEAWHCVSHPDADDIDVKRLLDRFAAHNRVIKMAQTCLEQEVKADGEKPTVKLRAKYMAMDYLAAVLASHHFPEWEFDKTTEALSFKEIRAKSKSKSGKVPRGFTEGNLTKLFNKLFPNGGYRSYEDMVKNQDSTLRGILTNCGPSLRERTDGNALVDSATQLGAHGKVASSPRAVHQRVKFEKLEDDGS